jgi:site-specific DNA-methyltransferase (adenine-specific)
MMNSIVHGDCLIEMQAIPDKSVDLILCDLPYGTTQNKWDSVIPFEPLWEQYKRIIKDSGAIVLFAQGLFSSKLQLSNEKWFRYSLIWEKDRPSGFLNAKRMPLRSHEDILVFYKKQPTYNPQFWEGEPLHGMGKKFKEGNLGNNNYGEFASYKNPSAKREGDTKKFPRSVLKFKRPHPPIFPTEKPVELCEYLIKTYSNKNDLVLDNCIGSGTTAIACVNTNRRFIGFELDKNNFDLANKRLGGIL